jgi:hypothetical protein
LGKYAPEHLHSSVTAVNSSPMNIQSKPVITYRWLVFLLAAGYCFYRLVDGSWTEPGGPFRFLTIWALFMSFFSASRMLVLSCQKITHQHEITAICTSVINVMVVYLYWKLYFTDPALVNGDGPIVWHQEYYLHAVGPALQIFDALFIGRVYKRVWRAALPLLGIILVYVAWAELFVQRFNTTPVGSVTSGLPYPFLNSMELSGRAAFYGANIGMAMAILLGFGIIGVLLYRVLRSQAAA